MHILQPKHSKLKPAEADELLAKLNTSRNQLPQIKDDDPAILDMGCKPGDILKVERKEGDKESIYFRVVV